MEPIPPSARPTRAPKSHSTFFGYDEGTGATPRTARPEDESGSETGFSKTADGSGPVLPPQLSAIGFYGQDFDEDANFSQRYSYSAYPASHEDASFGGSFGYPPHAPHPYGDRERSSSFSSLYPPPSTESVDSESEGEDPMSFTVSTILPNFLFLGPEPTNWDHVKQLKELGVRRIVNLAAECGPNDWGLGLDEPGNKEKEGSSSLDDSSKESGFEKYYKIPMRDTVEEDGIGRGVRVACEMLDHARLLSAPVYVHCKAGKSRSVTAVIAYLIHANHWPLSKAYSFVLERRKGISPNIGFVSELMGFEEEELGGKSGGVSGAAWGAGKGYAKHYHRQGGAGGAGALPQPSAPAATREDHGGNAAGGSSSNNQHGYGVVASMRKSGNARESMPPPATHAHHGYSYSVNEPSITSRLLSDDNESGSGSSSGSNSASSSTTASPEINGEYRTEALYGNNLGGSGVSQGPSFPPLSAGGILALGDAAQELEVRDANGRYRHARRAPVNEMTLQPMRRVSKAGLESGEFYRGDGRTTWGEEEEEAVVIESDTHIEKEE
ncbi:MAG: protein-tyrosine phosphatase-like protein [Lentinula lateritia]|nr:MAG: protein-tyrosine phosphatase-like protein [Lentinula lateritia]